MDTIVHRAEQAVLGALLAAPSARPPSDIAPGDFADRRHRAIFAALTGAGPQPGGLLNRLRAWLAGLPWRQQVRDLHAYLDELPAACPDPANLPRYAAMVHQASGERGTVAEAGQASPDIGRLAGAVAWLERETEKAAAQRRRPHLFTPVGDSVLRDLAVARGGLRAAARQVVRSEEAPVSTPRSAAAQAAPQRPGPDAPATAAPPERRPVQAVDLQELVLADLLQHREDAKDITGWLPAEVFTSGVPRMIYSDIRRRVQAGEPVDPLIIAWDLRHARADQAVDPGYVLRVAALGVAPGTAAVLGRALFADWMYTLRFGADWPHSPRLPSPITQNTHRTDAEPALQSAAQPAPAPSRVPEPGTGPAPAAPVTSVSALIRPSSPPFPSGPVPRI